MQVGRKAVTVRADAAFLGSSTNLVRWSKHRCPQQSLSDSVQWTSSRVVAFLHATHTYLHSLSAPALDHGGLL